MKRKVLFWMLGVLLVTVASVSVSMNHFGVGTSGSLMLANIEALADGEGGGISLLYCYEYGNTGGKLYKCQEGSSMVQTPPPSTLGTIYACSGTITPSIFAKTGYCFKPAN